MISARFLRRRPDDPESDAGFAAASMAGIYHRAAGRDLTERDPIVFIPGIMGSKLVDAASAQSVWGDFSRVYADPAKRENRSLIALPMDPDLPLDELTSSTEADGALGEARPRRLPITVGAYRDILHHVGVGGVGAGGKPEFGGGAAFASFEFGYDWRRSLDETARRFDRFLRVAAQFVQAARGDSAPVRFDVVAHSMGGLVLRYFLRYGGQRLPEDGSAPRLTWAGAERVSRAILIGTPNGGAPIAIARLVEGLPAMPLVHPGFDPFIVGTMPALYQLLPRPRHQPFLDPDRVGPIDHYDPEFWIARRWGLAADDPKDLLALHLDGVDGRAARREIALHHLGRCLRATRSLHMALDLPADPPPGLDLHLIVGDAHATAAAMSGVPGSPKVHIARRRAGDGTVPRSSALLDEREGGEWRPHVDSPIRWSSVSFATSNHMALTRDRVVLNNVLYRLLEDPR